jgi:NAD(P)-dependent dehydrogenase (short-subunit alcohol dehydrogenase family)
MNSLQGKVAIVTGGNSGMGKGAALRLVARERAMLKLSGSGRLMKLATKVMLRRKR